MRASPSLEFCLNFGSWTSGSSRRPWRFSESGSRPGLTGLGPARYNERATNRIVRSSSKGNMETRKKQPSLQSGAKRKIIVNVTVTIFKEGDYLVAYCPALELSSYGRTVEAAKKAFSQAMDIFMEETEKRGTLERALLSLGWSLRLKPSCRYEPPFFMPNQSGRWTSWSRRCAFPAPH